MKRHQEILEFIGGIIGLGVLCFFAYKAYQVITEFPVFFGAVGGVLILWLLYNFRITAARICLYFNPKTSYNLLKNHLEKGRAVALKKYVFGKAVYHIYYKSSKEERVEINAEAEKAEQCLTDAFNLLRERDKKLKEIIKPKELDGFGDEMSKRMADRKKDFHMPFIFIHQLYKGAKIFIPIAFRLLSIYLYYSFLGYKYIYFYRGSIRSYILEKHQLSLQDFKQGTAIFKEDKYLFSYGLACSLYNLERYDESFALCEESLSNNKDKEFAYLRGLIYDKRGNREAACKNWKQAIDWGLKESVHEKYKEKCTTC